MPRELRWPPAPLTTDWDAAAASIERLADLRPRVVAAGHGLPLIGEPVTEMMNRFAQTFSRPAHGRYVQQSARVNERGVVNLPPPVPDPVGETLWLAAASTAVAALMFALTRPRRGRRQRRRNVRLIGR
jgi:hypothetical protein